MSHPDGYVTRASLGWGATAASHANTDLGMIAHYDSADGHIYKSDHVTPKEHAECVSYWKHCRIEHMKGNGWSDVGYAYFVCPHDKIFAGREVNHQQAAEAPTPGKLQNGNSRYVAVTFATGPKERPNDAQIRAWHRLRAWLMSSHGLRTAVHGHRDFTSTSCPGDYIYGLVKNGVLGGDSKAKASGSPVPVTPTTDTEKGIDLVAKLPVLGKGDKGYDVLTLRAVLYQRFLAERYYDSPEELMKWLRNQKFTSADDNNTADNLDKDIRDYQKWRGIKVDGIVGETTWGHLLKVVS